MIVMVSGGFDPLHVGHLDLLEAAAHLGSKDHTVIVALHSNDWLFRKKGYVFMPHADRARLLKALECVADVSALNDYDDTVCEALKRIRPDAFANGGDRVKAHPAEAAICEELGIQQIFNVGGSKVRSSSDLIKAVR